MTKKQKKLTEQQKRVCANLKRIWDAKKGELGLTQQKAADKLDVSQGAVLHWLQGRNALTTQRVIEFAALLEVDPQDIDPSQIVTIGRSAAAKGGLSKAQLRVLDLLSSGFASGALSDSDAKAIETLIASRLLPGASARH